MKTKIKPRYLKGDYVDPDAMIVHAAFEALTWYVENEMDIVEWYDTDDEDDESSLQEHVKLTRQAKKDIMELYDYWKEINKKNYHRKNDPIFGKDVPKLKIKSKKIKGKKASRLIFKYGDGSKKDEKAYRKASNASRKWERDFEKKQEKMLIKLIKVRQYLWA